MVDCLEMQIALDTQLAIKEGSEYYDSATQMIFYDAVIDGLNFRADNETWGFEAPKPVKPKKDFDHVSVRSSRPIPLNTAG